MGCLKSEDRAPVCPQSRHPMDSYQFGGHVRGGMAGSRPHRNESWENHYSEYMNRLIRVQKEVKIMKPQTKSYGPEKDEANVSPPQSPAGKPYPVILSPYSSCWWEQPDPVIPPEVGGSKRYYRGRLRSDTDKCVDEQHRAPREIAIGPAKRPFFEAVPKSVLAYWHCRPGRTEYDDSISFTGYIASRAVYQYREPVPSCRRRKEDKPY
ncbi:uncharacterized protein LOC124169215 [Ischnura elegans]|uniref:uncharacterized protein LOC124169215 n=1 Tax=Ischnura elegans TaxID=197161 RepID=UPI001ED8B82A|nr:uncharacterized protein LOC124169215 [Ischnura elegans]